MNCAASGVDADPFATSRIIAVMSSSTTHANTQRSDHPHARGIALMVAALCVLICLDAMSKFAVQKIPVVAVTWSRYLGHMLCVFLFAYPMLRSNLWKTGNLPLQLLRGTLLAVMSTFYFLAVKTLPLAHATAILFVTPLLITLWAKLFLHEKVPLTGWLAVGLGFVGVLIVCRPNGGMNTQGALYALAAALVNSGYQILTRKMSGADQPEAQLFFTGLVGASVLTATLPAWWQPMDLDTVHWAAFIVIGGLGALGHWLLVKAYTAAPASALTPWMTLQLALSVVLGWLIFGDVPDQLAILGMVLLGLAPQITRWKR
jgi:drug/metabolite transporter (DMT)-like permease